MTLRIGAVGGTVLALVVGLASSAGAALHTRSCGSTHHGFPVALRATANVNCGTARHVIGVADGEGADQHCYSGPGRFHPCTVSGFRCTMRSIPGTDISSTRCTRGRNKLITGQT